MIFKFKTITQYLVATSVLFFPFRVFAEATNCIRKNGLIRIPVPCEIANTAGPAGDAKAGELALSIISILLVIVGSLAVIYLIIGGYRYITAHGNEEAAEGAKKTIQHAIMGLVLTILAFAIITIIANILVGGRQGVFR